MVHIVIKKITSHILRTASISSAQYGQGRVFDDPWENRTPVAGVRGRSLNRLTNGPYCFFSISSLYRIAEQFVSLKNYADEIDKNHTRA